MGYTVNFRLPALKFDPGVSEEKRQKVFREAQRYAHLLHSTGGHSLTFYERKDKKGRVRDVLVADGKHMLGPLTRVRKEARLWGLLKEQTILDLFRSVFDNFYGALGGRTPPPLPVEDLPPPGEFLPAWALSKIRPKTEPDEALEVQAEAPPLQKI